MTKVIKSLSFNEKLLIQGKCRFIQYFYLLSKAILSNRSFLFEIGLVFRVPNLGYKIEIFPCFCASLLFK